MLQFVCFFKESGLQMHACNSVNRLDYKGLSCFLSISTVLLLTLHGTGLIQVCLKTHWLIIHGASLTTLQWFICDILCSGSSVDDPLCGQSMIGPFLESDDL